MSDAGITTQQDSKQDSPPQDSGIVSEQKDQGSSPESKQENSQNKSDNGSWYASKWFWIPCIIAVSATSCVGNNIINEREAERKEELRNRFADAEYAVREIPTGYCYEPGNFTIAYVPEDKEVILHTAPTKVASKEEAWGAVPAGRAVSVCKTQKPVVNEGMPWTVIACPTGSCFVPANTALVNKFEDSKAKIDADIISQLKKTCSDSGREPVIIKGKYYMVQPKDYGFNPIGPVFPPGSTAFLCKDNIDIMVDGKYLKESFAVIQDSKNPDHVGVVANDTFDKTKRPTTLPVQAPAATPRR